MPERVNTGGVKSFDYSKLEKQNLSDKQRKEIRDAYAKAAERKAREKRNRIIIWIIVILVLIVLGILFLK